jgi:hypothetical protein
MLVVFFSSFPFFFFIKFYIIFFILLCFYILVTIKFNVSNSNTIMNLMSSIISNRALFQKPISKCECLTFRPPGYNWNIVQSDIKHKKPNSFATPLKNHQVRFPDCNVKHSHFEMGFWNKARFEIIDDIKFIIVLLLLTLNLIVTSI